LREEHLIAERTIIETKSRSDMIVKYFSEKVSPAVHDVASKKEAFGDWKADFSAQLAQLQLDLINQKVEFSKSQWMIETQEQMQEQDAQYQEQMQERDAQYLETLANLERESGEMANEHRVYRKLIVRNGETIVDRIMKLFSEKISALPVHNVVSKKEVFGEWKNRFTMGSVFGEWKEREDFLKKGLSLADVQLEEAEEMRKRDLEDQARAQATQLEEQAIQLEELEAKLREEKMLRRSCSNSLLFLDSQFRPADSRVPNLTSGKSPEGTEAQRDFSDFPKPSRNFTSFDSRVPNHLPSGPEAERLPKRQPSRPEAQRDFSKPSRFMPFDPLVARPKPAKPSPFTALSPRDAGSGFRTPRQARAVRAPDSELRWDSFRRPRAVRAPDSELRWDSRFGWAKKKLGTDALTKRALKDL
jgi:hypothetical protein